MWFKRMFVLMSTFFLLSGAHGADRFDPRNYFQVLGFDAMKHNGKCDNFKYIMKRFGKAKIITTGDALTSNTEITYATQDLSETIGFYFGEVWWGYEVSDTRKMDKSVKELVTLPQPKIQVAGIYLGISRSDIEKMIPTGKVGGDFQGKLKKNKKRNSYYFERTFKSSTLGGETVYDDIYLSFDFDKSGHLVSFDISESEQD